MASDIRLNDDDSVAIVADDLHLAHATGDVENDTVNVYGHLQFIHRILIGKAPPPPPPSKYTGSKISPQKVKGPDLGKYVAIAAHNNYVTLGEKPKGVATGALKRLKAMSPPYDLYEMLETMRQAILDLQQGTMK